MDKEEIKKVEKPVPPVIIFEKGKPSDIITIGFPEGKTNKPKKTSK